MVEGLPEKQMRKVQNLFRMPAMLADGSTCARRFSNRSYTMHFSSSGIEGKVHAIP